MDFLDPKKQKEHARRLIFGYVLIGLVLLLATIILLYQGFGYGLDKSGRLIQKGLVFMSSTPEGADIYINDKKYKDGTNARITPAAGQYIFELKKNGYRNWKRAVTVEGGSVARFDYPFLFPVDLKITLTKQYAAAPAFASTSPDHRWLLVGMSDQTSFELFDLNAKELAAKPLAVPLEILPTDTTTKHWQVVQWAKDNRHVVLKRDFDKAGTPGSEYILFDRQEPALSRNLSVTFGFTPTTITLRKDTHDEFYLFDKTAAQLFTASLKKPTPQLYQRGVLAFANEDDQVVFATTEDAPADKVLIQLKRNDDRAYTLRQVSRGSTYVLGMTLYEDKMFVAAGATVEDSVYVYDRPLDKLQSKPDMLPAPIQNLKVSAPTHISFSENERFVMIQNREHFAVYDAETDRVYAYQSKLPLDKPELPAQWMDGFRLSYSSGGNVVVFDYDGTNAQSLVVANPLLPAVFDSDFRFMYTFSAQHALNSTALRTPEDL